MSIKGGIEVRKHRKLSEDELLNKIDELERTILALKAEKNQYELLNFPWVEVLVIGTKTLRKTLPFVMIKKYLH